MEYALIHGNLLDGKLDNDGRMPVKKDCALLVKDGKIEAILAAGEEIPADYERIDLTGKYILPGLINAHVHLAPSSKPKENAKPTDYGKLSALIRKHPWIVKIFARMQKKMVRELLYSGVTTIRTVGGLQDLDAKMRERIDRGELPGPRILACNTAVSVPGGHFAGLLATESRTPAEAARDVERIAETKPDWIKLMVTGGVLDATEEGEPGVLRMQPEIIKAACDKAHELGYRVAAHVESPEGVRLALENGVDTIEHGAEPDEEILRLFEERKAADICTLSPALPFMLSEKFGKFYGEIGKKNGTIVLNGIMNCAKACLERGIPVGLGTDTGCPYVMQYDMWRELAYFAKYCQVSPDFAIHTATCKNAEILGIAEETGTLDPGKSADFFVVEKNPLEDLRVLRDVYMVALRGKITKAPKLKKDPEVAAELDPFLEEEGAYHL